MADTTVFTRLKRLFTTDVIIRNVGGNQLKVLDFSKYQVAGEVETNSMIDRYNRLYTTNQMPVYNPALNYQTLRTQLYSDYEAMDTDAIIASALDIISDESTLKNEMGEVLQIKSSDETLQKILYNLFYDVLNIEFNLWMWIRQMCKYGDFFLKLEIADKFGVYNVIPYTAYNIVREEGTNKESNQPEVKFKFDPDGLSGGGQYGGYFGGLESSGGNGKNTRAIYFDNYEIAHFRLLSDVNYLPYGRSYVEPARKLFKQYTLMEDAMLVHRIARAPEKRIFYINVGSIPPAEIENFMQKTISKMKRTPYIDQQTGDYNLKYNMQNMLEDFYIPVRGNDTSTKIDTAPGLQYDGINDVEYLRDKLFAALKIPKAFLGYDENTDGKATLAAEDIRFARTVERIQRIILSELYKIAVVHLYTQGYDGDDLVNFELNLTTPSIIYDQERVALMKEKVDLAAQMQETKLFPSDFIYDHLFHFSEDEYSEFRDLVREDSKRKFRNAQLEAEGNDPVESGESYGTPHDLASLYGKGRYYDEPDNVPAGYNEKEMGRPEEKVSNINTQDGNFGKDRLGVDAMKGKENESNSIKPTYKGGSPLALEAKTVYLQNKDMLKKLPINRKQLVFEQEESLLNENNLKE
tara:strand:+ start:1232 stop:3136 length:1905 start_codon:yes stop_codon:yes gene_type:complete